jgi:hypothetical protein
MFMELILFVWALWTSTGMILDALSVEGIPATFFAYGSAAVVYPTVMKVGGVLCTNRTCISVHDLRMSWCVGVLVCWQRMVDNGHSVGSFSSSTVDVTTQFLHSAWSSINTAESELLAAGSCVAPRTFRAPLGYLDEHRQQLLYRMGYSVVGYNFNPNASWVGTVSVPDVTNASCPAVLVPDFHSMLGVLSPTSLISYIFDPLMRNPNVLVSSSFVSSYIHALVDAAKQLGYSLVDMDRCLLGGQ